MSDDEELLPLDGTDAEWFAACGMCGGCGSDTCHEGPCTDDLDICRKCTNRQRQGWFCRTGCSGPGCDGSGCAA